MGTNGPHQRPCEWPLHGWSLSDNTLSDGKPTQQCLRGGLIEHCSTRQGGADELLLRVIEEVSKRHEKTVIAGVVGSPVLALNDPMLSSSTWTRQG